MPLLQDDGLRDLRTVTVTLSGNLWDFCNARQIFDPRTVLRSDVTNLKHGTLLGLRDPRRKTGCEVARVPRSRGAADDQYRSPM